ncbi:methyl-accepting chemotaxis protein [Gilvimarinus xylanilyticus]|uniref:Methyl-accepting chemotaxis protein n=1 Tax=Gilvimarinus xylanilyticus TaxID=2944139 RepID=A0A9X2KW58_9GAMM|nr:PAS domain-containing methyl-accepting chemotaxis protein [Gilvimarinus xylanilyticus]MCP8898650.1 methyl-accepting chemotaxis protein [Gilvimarinus xylanilyticus]
MRNNGPVTQKEVPVKPGEEIVSATDLNSKITFCNPTFVAISGFEEKELIGQPHNILRHPDMPSETFGMLWGAIKQGKPWMGVVKNRCKNGDHYWVDAYVTPVGENGRTTGYESVRVQAERALVQRAEQAYARLLKGQSYCPPLKKLWQTVQVGACSAVVAMLVLVLVSLATQQIHGWSIGIIAALLGIGAHVGVQLLLKAPLQRARETHHDPAAAYIYTGRSDIIGEILLANLAQKARLRTALGRFEASASDLAQHAQTAQLQAQNSFERINEQHQQTTSVAHSMAQMSIAVQEVAAGATKTSSATRDALSQVEEGQKVIGDAGTAVSDLSVTVQGLSEVLNRLIERSANISSVVDVIKGIAEQTNLLALNAAIEAARAGEQGRGFAVVADEVRTLAQRTQQSTEDIHNMIAELTQTTSLADEKMQICQTHVSRSDSEMEKVISALAGITSAVEVIDQMSHQIAAAAEEQSATANDIDQNTQAITSSADAAQREISEANRLNKEMSTLSDNQFELVKRFQ